MFSGDVGACREVGYRQCGAHVWWMTNKGRVDFGESNSTSLMERWWKCAKRAFLSYTTQYTRGDFAKSAHKSMHSDT